MSRHDAMKETFEEVTILDIPALFTPVRINRSTVPDGYYLYEVRHDDDCRCAAQVARNIIVNYWGSLITRDEIKLPDDGYLDIEPDALNYDTGNCHSVKDYIEKYPLRYCRRQRLCVS